MQATNLPSPAAARDAAHLTKIALAAKVPCSLSTVYDVERSGEYPANPSLRAAYLAALGLSEAVKS